MINEILLRRKSKINIPVGKPSEKPEKQMLMAVVKNIEALGFGFSKEVFDILSGYSPKELEDFYMDIVPKLKALVGADKEYKPMYPNFPKQVMEADDIELVFNALVHYLTFGQLSPEYRKDERLPLFDENKITLLSLGTTEDIMDILINLLSAKTSLSGQDKADIEGIIGEYADYYKYLPEEIPLKENVALLCRIILDKAAVKNAEAVQKYFKTPTDVLRLVTAMSDGDISLAAKTKYRKLKRAERRMVMDLLAGCSGDLVEDFFRYQYEWIRMGEIVHPFEYKADKYIKVNNAFRLVREGDKPLMFGGRVHKHINEGAMESAADLLKQRPGELARHMDKLLRDSSDEEKEYILDCFASVANRVSTPVLLQIRQHFLSRDENEIRVFFPKGIISKAASIPNDLKFIDDKTCETVVKICEDALRESYKTREPMGKVFIDEKLKNCVVPFSQRSASASSKILTRGSRFSVDENVRVIRPFIWWTNTEDNCRVDIDLSAGIFDENWKMLDHISYKHLRSKSLNACHSGDITDGGDVNGKGVAEFIDIDIASVAESGRYVVFQVYDYSCHGFSKLTNCRFGWMLREKPDSGEIFEPSTVEMKLELTADSVVAVPVVFDCVKREFIWFDMNLSIASLNCGGNNLESNLSGVKAACYAVINISKPNLYDLAVLNAQARGTVVADRNEADIVFSNNADTEEKIITAYDIDYIVGKLL